MAEKTIKVKELNEKIGITKEELNIVDFGENSIENAYIMAKVLESVNGYLVAQSKTKKDFGLVIYLNDMGWISTGKITNDGETITTFETYQDLREYLKNNLSLLSELRIVLVTSEEEVEDCYSEAITLDDIIGEELANEDVDLEDEEDEDVEYFSVDEIAKMFGEDFADEIEEEEELISDEEAITMLDEIFGTKETKSKNEELTTAEKAIKEKLEQEGIYKNDSKEVIEDDFQRALEFSKDDTNFKVVGIDRNTKLSKDQYYVVMRFKIGEAETQSVVSGIEKDFTINDLIKETEKANELLNTMDIRIVHHLSKVISKKDEREIWAVK